MRKPEKNYDFSSDIKRQSHRLAREAGYRSSSVHHILPKSLAKIYGIDPNLTTSQLNAIALDHDFHDEIHTVWDTEDFIFVACALLDLTYEDFTLKRRR